MICRKPVWAKLKSTAFEGLTRSLYTPLSTRAAQACLQSRSLGVAKLRLLPKTTGKPAPTLSASHCQQSHIIVAAQRNGALLSLLCSCVIAVHVHSNCTLAEKKAATTVRQDFWAAATTPVLAQATLQFRSMTSLIVMSRRAPTPV